MSRKLEQPIRRVLVVAKIGSPEGARLASNMADWLERRGIVVLYDAESANALGPALGTSPAQLPADVDLANSLAMAVCKASIEI